MTVLLTIGLPGLAWACEPPEQKPEIPDPNTAVTAQMVKANNEVKTYVSEMEAYFECARLPSAKYRKQLKELEEFAETFNEAIRTFKARK